MEKVSLSGRGIYRLEAGQLGLWIQRRDEEDGDSTGPSPTDPASAPVEALTAAVHAQQLGARLHQLDLSHNALETLCGLEGLSQLRILDLSHNRLSTLNNDQGFGGGLPLTLTHLNLSHNQLVSLGHVSVLSAVNRTSRSQGGPLQALQHLHVIDVSYNRLENLKALPADSLRELDAGHNELRQLDGIEQCRGLTVLVVAHNILKDPASVASLKSLSQLRTLSMEGNPLVVRKRILQSVLYLLPPSLAHTDLPIALPDPVPLCLTHADTEAEHISRHRPAAATHRPSTSSALVATSPPSDVSWEVVARVLREELSRTREERDRLAEHVAELQRGQSPHASAGLPRTPPPQDVVLSIIGQADDDTESVHDCSLAKLDDDDDDAVAIRQSTEMRSGPGARGHPYDIPSHQTPRLREGPHALPSPRSPPIDSPIATHELSTLSSSPSPDCSRHERRRAATDVMSKLRRANTQ